MMLPILLLTLAQRMALAATISVSSYQLLPSTAAGPPVPTPPAYRIEDFGSGAYMVTEGAYQCAFFVSDESVIAVDAPPTIGEGILHAIKSVTSKPVSHVVYSHHHADHISGAYLFGSPPDITIIAHAETAKSLARTPEYTRPAPSITFETNYTLDVGNQTLQLDYRGRNHDPGNIFIYHPQSKVLMLVDIVYPGWSPFNELGEVQSIPGYIKAHDDILTYDFDHYIGGHLDRSGTREDVLVAKEYIHDLFNTSVAAINASALPDGSLSASSVIVPAVLGANPHNSWAVFEEYTNTLTDWVYEDMASRWNHRLYANDVFGRSHAASMVESVRIDFGILGPFAVPAAGPLAPGS